MSGDTDSADIVAAGTGADNSHFHVLDFTGSINSIHDFINRAVAAYGDNEFVTPADRRFS